MMLHRLMFVKAAALCAAVGAVAVVAALPQQPSLKKTVQVFRLGGENAPPEYSFANTPALVVADNGFIYARIQNDATVSVYKPDGSFVRNIGRKGKGPGEFYLAVSHGLLGDTLWIGDFPTPRISRILTNGTHIATAIVAFPSEDALAIPTKINGLLQNGRVSAVLPRRREGSCETGGTAFVIARLPKLTNRDTVAILQPQGLSIPCVGDWSLRAIAHSPSVSIASNGSGIATLTWSDADPGAFTVRMLSPDGVQRWTRTLHVARAVEVPRAIRDSIVDAVLVGARPQIEAALRNHTVTGTAKALVERGLDIPRYYPPVRRVLIGIDGTTWVEQSLDLQGGTWIVLDNRGATLFRVLLPPAMIVHQASKTDMWGVEVDSLGIAYMVKRHIVD